MNLLDEYSEDELLNINTNFLRLDGIKLKKKAWFKDRGLRMRQDYIYEPTGEIKISELYEYEYKNDKREVSSYIRKVEWYDGGEVIQSQDTTPDLTIDHLSDVNKSARNAQVEYLELSADNLRNLADTLPEPYRSQYIQVAGSIDLLLNHYEGVTRKYRERKLHTIDFENAVLFETNPQILAIHQIPVRPPDDHFPNGLNVKQAIIYQLKGLVP